MTMDHAFHPDHERLAAYAGGDTDAVRDRELAAHLASCPACRSLTDELSLLRMALAELPDVAPPRPLRLVPPVVSQPAPRAGALAWLRRLTAPAMAAGAGLVLIGAIGAVGQSGVLRMSQSAGGAGPESAASSQAQLPSTAAPSTAADTSTDYGKSAVPRANTPGAVPSPVSSPALGGLDGGTPPKATTTGSPELPWLTLVIAGVALLLAAGLLRYSLSPRAG